MREKLGIRYLLLINFEAGRALVLEIDDGIMWIGFSSTTLGLLLCCLDHALLTF